MVGVQDNSITRKLTRMNVLVSGAALLIACTAFIAYDLVTFREAMVYNLSIQAQIIGSNSVSSLVFDDPSSAERTLLALRASPNIVSAGVHDSNGRLFAHYRRDSAGEPPILRALPPGQVQDHWFGGGEVILVRSIEFGGKSVGTVYIRSDQLRVNTRLRRYVWIAALVLAASLLAALMVSSAFRRSVARPIVQLAKIARTVSTDKNYSVRAAPTGGRDELALLVNSFNEMLSEIQERDAALQQAQKELEQRVQERTAQLSAANQELEAFSYSVSHDLRAPLRSIDGFSQALLEDYADKLDEVGKDHLRRARSAANRMAQLIDDLLNLSRVTRAEMAHEKVDLSYLAREVAAEFQKTHPERSAQFLITPGLLDTCDARLLRQVFENLFSNAWKFTSKHPHARIEFGIADHNGIPTYFVRDDGAGFEMEYSARLFGAFQRLHTVREFPGTGVGLATVQRIIHRHGGRVWAEGQVGKGATFYFTLMQTPENKART